MIDLNQIHEFAVKWSNKFKDQNIDYIELIDHHMADDCKALGFEMDCGHTFTEKYGNAASDYEALNKIVDEIDDIPLLGSAIYSHDGILTIGLTQGKKSLNRKIVHGSFWH